VCRSLSERLIVLVISACLCSTADASTIVLQSGQKLQGQIIEQTELRVTVDIQGAPYTFYLGEIASIDGRPVEMPREKAVESALVKAKKPVVPNYHDQETSLIRFMNKKNPQGQLTDQTVPSQETSVTLASSAAVNKSVVSTPDGGLIVVDSNKIIKFDKNLQIVKEVDLTKVALPAVIAPVAAPLATPLPAVSSAPASSPAGQSNPPKLKDFLTSFSSSAQKS